SDAPVGNGKGDGVGVGWAFGEYDRHKPLLLFGVGRDGIVHQFAQSLDAGHVLMSKAREGAFIDPDVDGVGMDGDFWIHGGTSCSINVCIIRLSFPMRLRRFPMYHGKCADTPLSSLYRNDQPDKRLSQRVRPDAAKVSH